MAAALLLMYRSAPHSTACTACLQLVPPRPPHALPGLESEPPLADIAKEHPLPERPVQKHVHHEPKPKTGAFSPCRSVRLLPCIPRAAEPRTQRRLLPGACPAGPDWLASLARLSLKAGGTSRGTQPAREVAHDSCSLYALSPASSPLPPPHARLLQGQARGTAPNQARREQGARRHLLRAGGWGDGGQEAAQELLTPSAPRRRWQGDGPPACPLLLTAPHLLPHLPRRLPRRARRSRRSASKRAQRPARRRRAKQPRYCCGGFNTCFFKQKNAPTAPPFSSSSRRPAAAARGGVACLVRALRAVAQPVLAPPSPALPPHGVPSPPPAGRRGKG